MKLCPCSKIWIFVVVFVSVFLYAGLFIQVLLNILSKLEKKQDGEAGETFSLQYNNVHAST